MLKADVPLNAYTFTSILDSYASKGDAEGMMRTFEEMTNKGIKPDVTTFTAMMDYFARRGQVEVIESLLDDMKTSGVKVIPYLHSYVLNIL
jgi:pentatricopeptide repeat protein